MLTLLAASVPAGLVLAGSFEPGTDMSGHHDLGGTSAVPRAVGPKNSALVSGAGPMSIAGERSGASAIAPNGVGTTIAGTNGSGIAAADLQIRPRMTEPIRAERTPGDRIARWGPIIDRAADRFVVPARWIVAVMQIESGGRTLEKGRPIRSVAGAMGLMQLMPGTWADMRLRHGLGTDPDVPADNILAGTAYLAAMHARFGYPGLFAAYHAGPGRYAQFLRGRPLPPETRHYVARIAALLAGEGAEGGDLDSRASAMDHRRPSQSGEGPPSLFAIGGPQALVPSDADGARAAGEFPDTHVPMPRAPGADENVDPPEDGDFGPQPQPGARRQEPPQRDRLFALPPRR
ncbi:lytic transglycosylase domain-containing protein [Sphingobium yanoikuyae]|uniref:lytic transglycosylase domain-containing protein n=1 Tax=Sphingobium yanoikuyae TaxID=13690 RepID=UPI0039C99FDC